MNTKREKFLIAICILLTLIIIGCGSMGDINADEPVVKGASYIACAIVTHGVIQAIFNG